MKKGFTLIELLVVVLIIAILAAVALPQYTAAVEKARLSTFMPIVKAVADAEERYYLANDSYTADFNALDVSLPGSCVKDSTSSHSRYNCDWGIIMIADGITNIQAGSLSGKLRYLRYIQDYTGSAFSAKKGDTFCFAKPDDSTSNKVCSSLGGTLQSSSTMWSYYKLP
ncbi:prepilin-type N-terminal cleavage/methylation domain-containing protein [Parelusimicrobium proximum]|uniref:type IV pilin protein n=1 Tax=Parelusimicrobium proximum TaxID=3228953 RepID=UPI003D183708